MQKLVIHNGKVITPFKIIAKGTMIVTGNEITAVCEGDVKVEDATLIDTKGKYFPRVLSISMFMAGEGMILWMEMGMVF